MSLGILEILLALGAQTIAVGMFVGATNGNVKRLIKDVEKIDARLQEMHILQNHVNVLASMLNDMQRRLAKVESDC
jgi:hypothetical protein